MSRIVDPKKFTRLAGALSAVFLCFTSLGIARTYYVKPTGNDYSNGTSEATAWQHIARACSTLVAGDTVLIRAGVYNEAADGGDGDCGDYGLGCGPLTPRRSGSAGRYIVYKGYPGERPVIQGNLGGNYARYAVNIWNKQYIVLDSLIVTNAVRGIYVDQSSYIIVKNCKVYDTMGPSICGEGGENNAGVMMGYYVGAQHCVVKACSLYRNWEESCPHPGYPINTWNCHGILSYRVSDCLYEDNVCWDQTFGIRMKHWDMTTVIRHNVVYNSTVGIAYGNRAGGCDIYENIIYDCDGGIEVQPDATGGADSVRVWNNVVYNCSGAGIKLYPEGSVSNFQSWNNIVVNSRGDIHREWTTEANNHPGLSEDYNCYYNANYSQVVFWNGASNWTLAQYQAATPFSDHSIQQNPLFVDAPNHDFRLQSNSPARGRGMGGVDMGRYPALDTVAPIISGVAANNITSTAATIDWNTNEPATSQVQYGLNTNYTYSTSIDRNLTQVHSQRITALLPDTLYHYRVRSSDGAGNETIGGDYIFRTPVAPPPDTTRPQINNVRADSVTDAATIIKWDTDEPATSQVNYGFTAAYGSNSSLDTTMVSGHRVVLNSLQPDTLYHFRVRSMDAAGNEGVSRDFIFRTDTASTLQNIALGMPDTVESTYPGYSQTPINDGVENPYGGTATTWASNENQSLPHWVEVRFGRHKVMQRVRICWAWNTFRSSWMCSRLYNVQYWSDSSNAWVNAAVDTNLTADSITTTDFQPVVTSKMRYFQPANMGPPAYSGVVWLTELEVYGRDVPVDTIPPGRINDLGAVTGPDHGKIRITWTARGEDGDSGSISFNEVKYSATPITEGNWPYATAILNQPPSGSPNTPQEFIMDGLPVGEWFYIGIKTYDDAGNTSFLSNVPECFSSGIKAPVALSTNVDPENGSATVVGSTVQSYLPLFYEFALDTTSSFTTPRIEVGLVADSTASATFGSLMQNVSYYWRCRAVASNHSDSSDWSGTINFDILTGVSGALANDDCIAPKEGETVVANRPTFSVSYVPDIAFVYFQVDENSQFTSPLASGPVVASLGNVTSWQITEPLEHAGRYFWRASSDNTLWTSPISFYAVLDVHPFPNPFRAADGTSGMTFTNLRADSKVIIATVSGSVVREARGIGPNDWTWDVKNDKGRDIASGVYLYFVDSPQGSASGKVMIIR